MINGFSNGTCRIKWAHTSNHTPIDSIYLHIYRSHLLMLRRCERIWTSNIDELKHKHIKFWIRNIFISVYIKVLLIGCNFNTLDKKQNNECSIFLIVYPLMMNFMSPCNFHTQSTMILLTRADDGHW